MGLRKEGRITNTRGVSSKNNIDISAIFFVQKIKTFVQIFKKRLDKYRE